MGVPSRWKVATRLGNIISDGGQAIERAKKEGRNSVHGVLLLGEV